MATEIDLKALKEATEQILIQAIEAREEIGGPVNWADLHCDKAEKWVDEDEDWGWRVYISEAAPDSTELQNYVATQLRELGYPPMEIKTEW